MVDLESLIYFLMFFVLSAVLVILVIGIISMLKGGNFNKKWGNKLMRARVGLQALAILLILLITIFFSR